MPKKLSNSQRVKSRYNNDCSAKGLISNFNKIRKDAAVTKPISSGSMAGDTVFNKIPIAGKYIKNYNTGTSVGAHIAHAVNAYNESCSNHKKK